MLHIHLNDLKEPSEAAIAKAIKEANGIVRITMTVRDQYQSNSKRVLALNWLKSWYMAEALAEYASESEVDFEEGERGAGEFEFRFTVIDPRHMAARIADFAAVLDEDDLEAGGLIYDEAEDWMNKPGRATRFP